MLSTNEKKSISIVSDLIVKRIDWLKNNEPTATDEIQYLRNALSAVNGLYYLKLENHKHSKLIKSDFVKEKIIELLSDNRIHLLKEIISHVQSKGDFIGLEIKESTIRRILSEIYNNDESYRKISRNMYQKI